MPIPSPRGDAPSASSGEAPSAHKALLAVPFVALLVHLARYIGLPLQEKLLRMPDDAFYYLEIAREFGRHGVWSFDRGRTITSGFHPLFGYFSALVERLLPGGDRVELRLEMHAVVAVAATLVAVALLVRVARRLFPRGVATAALMVGAAGGLCMLPFEGMEWSFTVLAGALTAHFFAKKQQRWLAVALVLGSTCRTDFALVGIALAVARASVDLRFRASTTRREVALIVGATLLGLAAVTLHSFVISGHLVQASARMKSYWGAALGYDVWYGIEPASYAFAPGYLLTRALDFGPKTLVVPMALLAGMYVSARPRVAAFGSEQRVVLRWSLVSILGYALVYAKISVLAQNWYSAHFVVPLFLLVASLASAVAARAHAGVTALAAVLAALNVWDARRPIAIAPVDLRALEHLERDSSVTLAGSWNAGAFGYLGGEKVVNVDGLVNDDVYPYVVRDRLHCYFVHERLPFVVEAPDWFTPKHASYMGFANGKLVAAMRPYDGGPGRFTVWTVDLARLAEDPACSEDLRSPRSKRERPYDAATGS